jgi:hypothetical protein
MRTNFNLRLIVAGMSFLSLTGPSDDAGASPISLPPASLQVLTPPGVNGGSPVPWSISVTSQGFLGQCFTNQLGPTNTWQQAASALPDPTVSASVSGGLCPTDALVSALIMQYSFEIVGGTAPAVPVDITTGWLVDASAFALSDGSGALARIDFGLQTGYQNQLVPDSIFAQGYQCASGSLAVPGNYPLFQYEQAQGISPVEQCGLGSLLANVSLIPNTLYSINMLADAVFYNDTAPATIVNGGASAFIDPSIYIDSGFADAADYSVILSTDVGNPAPASSVPEPASFVLLGSGLVATVSRFRRRLSAPFTSP